MRTHTPLALLLCATMAAPIMAQQDLNRLLNELRSSEGGSLIIGDKRYDLVGADYAATTTNKDAFMRITMRVPEGWAVEVLAADGDPLMTGTYADEQLTIADGTFTYFHCNDRMESTGAYLHGIKTGVWSRYDTSGNLLGERIYHGLGTDDLLVKERVASRAGTH